MKRRPYAGAYGRLGQHTLVVVVQLGAQQGAQAGGAGVFTGRLLRQGSHGFLLVGSVLGLDRQLDVAGLAIHVDHHGGDFVAFLEHVAELGPEGGVSPEEVAAFEGAGAVKTGLGPRILRAETAPLYALSAISYATELLK